MELEVLASGACADVDTCPMVYRAGSDLAAVIGKEVTDPAVLAKVRLGPGEKLFTFPLAMITEAAEKVE